MGEMGEMGEERSERLEDGTDLKGKIEVFERPNPDGNGRYRRWRKVYETENIVLNQFYQDLLTEMQSGSAFGGLNLLMNAMALGIGTSTPARTDAGLGGEWQGTNVAGTTSSLASGTPITAVPCSPLAVALPAAAAITVAGQAMTVTGAGAAIAATSIPVNSVTPSPTIPTGSAVAYAAASSTMTPQRLALTNVAGNYADPPQATFSYYLPAGSNSVAVQFQEAGLLYNASSLVAAGSPTRWATHAAFVYQKAPNTDVRLDYTLQRILT
jgi:hypothetical protein